MTWLLVMVPLWPIIAALVVAIAGLARADTRHLGWLVVAGCAASLGSLLVLEYAGPAHMHAGAVWADVGGHELTVSVQLDGLAWVVAVMVAAIALVVNIYAVGYMAGERGRARFCAWMGVFAGAMLALVLSGSFLLLFASWEIVGLASYALIGFHHRDAEARRAATRAFLVTRLGDMGLLLGWLLALSWLGTTEIAALTAVAGSITAPALFTILAVLFLIAALGKSAQLPLSMWLPGAMIGPTPVSALIHSATMVAAGVYLILRLFPVFGAAPHVLDVLAWLGAITALTAALVATAQHELKRVLAWSTISHLGEMMLGLGLGVPAAAAHYLIAHAVFKSGLFLAAGAVQKATGARSLDHMGGLMRRMPWTATGFIACALALAGVPFLAGYFAEEALLGGAVARGPGWAAVIIVLVLLAGLYIGRAAMAVFGSWPGAPRPEAEHVRRTMLVPLWILALAAVAGGWAVEPLIGDAIAFRWPSSPAWGWSVAAALAGVIGLLVAAARVRRCGPVPVLGAWPLAIARGLDAVTRAPALAARSLARGLDQVESVLDGAVRALVSGVRRSARGADRIENVLDRAASVLAVGVQSTARGADRIENVLDRAASVLAVGVQSTAHGADMVEGGLDSGARRAARACVVAASGVERAESRGFGAGGDALAHGLSRAGQGVRGLEVGKVYIYAMALFGWVLVVAVAAVAWWITWWFT